MKIDFNLFRSKIAWRIYLLFVSCALIPILCLSAISYLQVTRQLREQSYKRLQQSAKAHGLSLYERLLSLESELQLTAYSLDTLSGHPGQTAPARSLERITRHFSGIVYINSVNEFVPVLNSINGLQKPSTDEIEHISSGKTAISYLDQAKALPRIIMGRLTDPENPESAMLFGEVNPLYLWGIETGTIVPPGTEICVLDGKNAQLFNSLPEHDSFRDLIGGKIDSGAARQFELGDENGQYLVAYQEIFMKPTFFVNRWTVVLSKSKAVVLAPMLDFKLIFSGVVILTILTVLLLSSRYIRKSLVPLELLKQGTDRVANKDFDYRVEISSRDEFQELADHFNEMSAQLSRQFRALDTRAEIDRAILSSLATPTIVETVINRMYEWFACNTVGISLMESESGKVRLYSLKQGRTVSGDSPGLTPSDLEKLHANPESLWVDMEDDPLFFLSPLAINGMRSFLVLPIFLNRKLRATIAIGRLAPQGYSEADITQARQMADQVAVALSKANLIEELDMLNWGTLEALARAVDAKSPWTSGHSERVTDMALEIGAVLKFSKKELDNLRRGALLHDIGKLGVPAAILDKRGKLDEEELRAIRIHPGVGKKILEPIAVYNEVIPLVMQHHERYDGKGYPDGLRGDEIAIGARVIAVADVFDALNSDRPYRGGMTIERIIDTITREAGHQFDPDIVLAFMEIMKTADNRV